MPALGLGTVQFGLPYGVTNVHGQVSADEASAILNSAALGEISVLDTAYSYGDSEAVLGRLLSAGHSFRIVTKIPPLRKPEIGPGEASAVREAFLRSLERLRQPSVEILLVHYASDLLAKGGEHLWKVLEGLRNEGLCLKIGSSLYDPEELSTLLQRFPLQAVQLPFSILDQRFAHPVEELRAQGVEIHARSLFLQGMVLGGTNPANPYFRPLVPYLERIYSYCQAKGISPLDLALAAVKHFAIDVALVGVSREVELDEILASWNKKIAIKDEDLVSFSCPIREMTNPALWPNAVRLKS